MLVGAIVLILTGYGWWLLASGKPPVPDAEIEVGVATAAFTPEEQANGLAHVPMFDPATGDWIVDGAHRRSIIGLVPPNQSPPPTEPRAIWVRLPAGAGQPVMQAAMRALASEGICTTALFVEGMKLHSDILSAPVITIRRVPDGHGGTMPCHDRLNGRR